MRVTSKTTRSAGLIGWIYAFALIGLIASIFRPVLGFEFLAWDDDFNVTHNQLLTDDWSWSLARKFFDGSTALRFKPVHWLLFRGIYSSFGFEPAAWHALGLVVHSAVAVLFFCVLRKLIQHLFPNLSRLTADWTALIGAGLWAVHPLRVEPVAWITGSTYLCTAFFLLGSFWAYLNAHETDLRKQRWRWFVVAWVLAVLSYATYPVGITYGLWLVAVDFGVLGVGPTRIWHFSDGDVAIWWKKHLLFLAPAFIAVGFTLWSRVMTPGIFNVAPPMATLAISDRLLMALSTISMIPAKVFWPGDLTPNLPVLEIDLWVERLILLCAMVSLSAIGFAILMRKKWPAFSWTILGFVGLSLPCLGLTEYPALPVDRYSYMLDFVMIGGLVIGASSAIQRWSDQKWIPPCFIGLAATILMIAVTVTVYLLPAWRNTDSLFMYMEGHADFRKNPAQEAHVYRLWTHHAWLDDRLVEAQWRHQLAYNAYLRAMVEALREQNYDKAVLFSRSMEVNQGIPASVRRERGYWLLKTGRSQEALIELKEALTVLPKDSRTLYLLQQVEAALQRPHN